MLIRITNTRCYIDRWPKYPFDQKLRKAFTYKKKDGHWANRSMAMRGRRVDVSKVCFISEKLGAFPTGILPAVLFWANKNGVIIEIDDQRKILTPKTTEPVNHLGKNPKTDKPFDLKDRQYQYDTIKEFLSLSPLIANKDYDKHKIEIPWKRGIAKLPTAAGKTFMSASLIKTLDAKTLYLLERVTLARQTKRKFIREYGFKPSEVGLVGGKTDEQGRKVTILVVQSAHLIKDMSEFEFILCDETHHANSKTYRDIFKKATNAYYRLGISGTPFSEDKLTNAYTRSQLGNLIYEEHTATLIDQGILAKPVVRMIEINGPNIDRIRDWHEYYKEGIVNNFDRNQIILKFANNFKGKTLILFRIIEHGHLLRKYLPQALYADGETSKDERDKIIDGFNKSYSGVMLASMILDEGIDFESVHHVILAGAGKSIIKNLQRLGRGLRANDIMQVNVIDFMDNQHKKLAEHSYRRIKHYTDEGHETKLFCRE